MPPSGAAYDVDWVLSTTSNVHVASHRDWFKDFVPYRTKISTMPGEEPSMEIHGIGTVVLPTRIHGEGKPHRPSSEITLHRVLYAPHSAINIFAHTMEPDLNNPVDFSKRVCPITESGTNKVVGLIVRLKLHKLWLKGQSKKDSSLDPDGMYYTHATWLEEEIDEFDEFFEKVLAVHESRASNSAEDMSNQLITKEELKFMRKHVPDMFKSVATYQLSKKYDQEEVRLILRAFMPDSEEETMTEEWNADDDQHAGDDNDSLAEMEEDPISHAADYKFSPSQLDYLKKHYGHSGHFMLCYELKPYDDHDCDEALSIIKAIMGESEDED